MTERQLKIFYADYIPLPLPEGHRFPSDKYEKTRINLQASLGLSESVFNRSPLASQVDLEAVHDPSYVSRVFSGTLSPEEIRRIGFPWTPDLVKRCQASTGGTFAAVKQALVSGYSAQLAGGTHHAHFDFGAGYCIFNDFAFSCCHILREYPGMKIAIIDLDVHQGDGNAAMLADNPNVFVLSIHGAKNYPLRKVPSDLDIGLPDKTEDKEYLFELEQAIQVVQDFSPDLILYQAGVDCLYTDALGRMKLTHSGLFERDRMIFSYSKAFAIPIVHVLGGGYSRPIDPTVTAYVQTFAAALSLYKFGNDFLS